MGGGSGRGHRHGEHISKAMTPGCVKSSLAHARSSGMGASTLACWRPQRHTPTT